MDRNIVWAWVAIVVSSISMGVVLGNIVEQAGTLEPAPQAETCKEGK